MGILNRVIGDQRKLYQASSVDMLTGIANRRKLMREGRKLLHKAKVKKTDFSLIMIDIDHFKKVNDQFGHGVGDQVIKKIVELGEGFMRKTDVFGRFGGEEFIVFLPNTSTIQAKKIAERFRIAVAKYAWQINHTSPEPLTSSISIGVASCEYTLNNEQYDLTALINKADILLYQAKEQGRNKVCS